MFLFKKMRKPNVNVYNQHHQKQKSDSAACTTGLSFALFIDFNIPSHIIADFLQITFHSISILVVYDFKEFL